ncbi:MAG: serine/threonine protein kinase [Desulfobacterales bacterium]
MTTAYTDDALSEMASRWMPSLPDSHRFRVHTDTSDFFQVDYGHIVILGGRPYLIRQSAKEGRFGLDDEVKHWVKRGIDLEKGTACFIKLVFYEKFNTSIGGIEFECFRSPRKEARILDLVRGHPHFMQGFWVTDEKDNVIRILDVIHGKTLARHVEEIDVDHADYFHKRFPAILRGFIDSVSAIRFLHDHGEKHGDIRRDHLLVDSDTGAYRWIDFDFNYRHRENIYGYDLFGLGNILMFLVGKGDVLVQDIARRNPDVAERLTEGDVNIVFHNRVANIQKVYPYVPASLNRVLLHFARSTHRFYDHTRQMLDDLVDCAASL